LVWDLCRVGLRFIWVCLVKDLFRVGSRFVSFVLFEFYLELVYGFFKNGLAIICGWFKMIGNWFKVDFGCV